MDTKDCIDAITKWIPANQHLLPVDPRSFELRKTLIARSGKSHVGDGTKTSEWKRRGIKKLSDGTVLRAFEGTNLIYTVELFVLVHEKDNAVTKIEHGTEEHFEETYSIRIGDYCGMN